VSDRGDIGDDLPDDLDEVTLWAGRLRAWPLAPPEDAEGDETVRSLRRAAVGDDRAHATDVESDETVRSEQRAGVAEDPARAADTDETARFRETATVDAGPSRGHGVDPAVLPDEDTAPSRAGRSRAEAHRVAVDDRTAHSRPAASAGRLGRVGGVSLPEAPAADDSAVPAFAAVFPVDDGIATDATAGEDTGPDAPATAGEDTGADAPAGDGVATVDDDGTAAVARRRNRAASRPAATDMAPVTIREARAPAALHRETYGPRLDAPVRVARNAAVSAPRVPETVAARPRRSREGARFVILAAAIVVVVALASVGVILLLG
jgi:hypothetical protein